jgi:signal transduction histidine kinase
MVIHDLKHPTDAIINQLQLLQTQMLDYQTQLERIADRVSGIEQDFECLKEHGRLCID